VHFKILDCRIKEIDRFIVSRSQTARERATINPTVRRLFMRTMALLGILALAQCAEAQVYPAKMTITMPEVDVRARPTSQYYVTSKLHMGDSVIVTGKCKDALDWYMILPPSGSFSWLNAKYVRQLDAGLGVVNSPGAKLRPGNVVDAKPPNVETVELKEGSQVSILGQGVQAQDGDTWLRIQPWYLEEVRYIPAEAVQGRQQFAGNFNNVPAQLANRPSQQSAWNAGPAASTPWPPTQTASFSQNNTAAKTITYPPTWSRVGILRRSTSGTSNGQATYALEDAKGHILLYVNCQPGFSLQNYVNRTVSVYGSINYHSDDALRTFVMQGTYVALY
jgi:hypothetical protein